MARVIAITNQKGGVGKTTTVISLGTALVKCGMKVLLIDSQPSLNILTINVLTAANGIIIPTQPEMYSIEGIMEIKRTFQKIRQSNLNPTLGIDGILITVMNNQTNYTKQERDSIINELCRTDHVYESCIPYTVKLKECGKKGVSKLRHCPRNKAAIQYELLAKEVIASEQRRRESKNRFGQLVSFNHARNKRKKGNRRIANR